MEDKDQRADKVPGGRSDKQPDISEKTWTPRPGEPQRLDRPDQPPIEASGPKRSERTLGGVTEAQTHLPETSLREEPVRAPEPVHEDEGPEDPRKPAVGQSDRMVGNKRVDHATMMAHEGPGTVAPKDEKEGQDRRAEGETEEHGDRKRGLSR